MRGGKLQGLALGPAGAVRREGGKGAGRKPGLEQSQQMVMGLALGRLPRFAGAGIVAIDEADELGGLLASATENTEQRPLLQAGPDDQSALVTRRRQRLGRER